LTGPGAGIILGAQGPVNLRAMLAWVPRWRGNLRSWADR